MHGTYDGTQWWSDENLPVDDRENDETPDAEPTDREREAMGQLPVFPDPATQFTG